MLPVPPSYIRMKAAEALKKYNTKPLSMEGRYNFLPVRDTNWPMMGDREWALPGFVASAVNAITAPGRALFGKEPFNAQEEAFNTSMNVLGGGLLSSRGRAPAGAVGANLWHGSPHKFDSFDLGKIGTGEGAQAYGHGIYFSESPSIAGRFVRSNETATIVANAAMKKAGDNPTDAIRYLSSSSYTPQVAKRAAEMIADGSYKKGGHLYNAEIADSVISNMLDWNKPLSQQPHVMKAFPEEGVGHITGQKLYENLQSRGYTKKDVSDLLRKNGIPGIRYLDRTGGEEIRNVVLFDDNLAKIVERQ